MKAVWAAVPWAKERRGVRGDLEVSPWFSNSEKGCEGPGLGREKAWKEYSY